MNPKLRPYQNKAVTDTREAFKKGHQRVVMTFATGGGKSFTFAEVIRLATLKGTQTLILTHRLELLKQNFNSMSVETQILDANTKPKDFDPEHPTTIAMVETIARRKLPEFQPDLIVIDEAHFSNFNKIMDRYPDAKVLGVTATPIGKHFHKYYTEIVVPVTIQELIDQGYLLPYQAFQMQDDEIPTLQVNRGEYTDQALMGFFNKRKLYEGVVTKWMEKARDLKTIVFCINIEHTMKTAEEFARVGISVGAVTSHTSPLDRQEILASFKSGAIQVLVNCGILTTGYDEPSIGCVILNRKTKSLPLFLQMIGRGSRPFEGMENFLVLDFGQNHKEHGLWSMDRDWKIEEPKRKKQADAPVKECPQCHALNYAGARECDNCGHVFQIKESKPETDGFLVEVTPTVDNLRGLYISQLTIDQLVRLQKSKRYKASFIWRVLTHFSDDSVYKYAKAMGYSQGWVWRQLQKPRQPFKDYIVT